MNHRFQVLQIVKNADRNCFLVTSLTDRSSAIFALYFNQLSQRNSFSFLAYLLLFPFDDRYKGGKGGEGRIYDSGS
jgi:hypothetical protein